jgi:hypothetical protein
MSSPAFNASQIQPVQLQNPLGDVAKIMQIKQQAALLPAQVQEAQQRIQANALDIQDKLRANADRAALSQSYQQAIETGPDGTPTTNRGKFTTAAVQAGASPEAIQAALKAFDGTDEAHLKIQKAQQDLEDAHAQFGASTAYAVRQGSKDNPDVWRQQLAVSAANKDVGGAQAQQAIALLDQARAKDQADPTGNSHLEQDLTTQQISQAIAHGGPAFLAAIGRKEAADVSAQEAPGKMQAQTNANAKAQQDANNEQYGEFIRSAAINPPADLAAATAQLSPANRNRVMALFPPGQPYDPAAAKQTFLKAGMTAEQQEKAENPPPKPGDDFQQFYKLKLAATGQQPSAANELAARKEWGQAGSTRTDISIASPQAMAATAQALAAGKIDPATARAMLRRNPDLLGQTLAVDPNFDEAQLEKRYGTAREFNNTSNAKAGGQVIALNTLIHHADLMQQAGEALQNGSFRPGNAAYNAISQMFGSAAPSNANLVARFLAGEAGKVATGGVPAEGEVNGILSSLGTNASPQQLQDAGNKIIQIAAGRMTPLQEKLKDANLDKVYQVVGPDARAILQKRGFDPDTMKPVAAAAGSGAPIPKTQAEYDALPKGAKFMKPNDQKVYVKQ